MRHEAHSPLTAGNWEDLVFTIGEEGDPLDIQTIIPISTVFVVVLDGRGPDDKLTTLMSDR